MEITVDTSGGLRKLERVERAIGDSVFARFRTLGRSLREELRPRIPKKTGRARSSIFSQVNAQGDEVTDLLVGGDLAIAPHLIYIEGGRGKTRGKVGPIRRFQLENEERIVNEVKQAVSAGVRAAGGNE